MTPENPLGALEPCLGHCFGEALRCECGMTFFAHQHNPEPCPLGAARRQAKWAQPKPLDAAESVLP